MANEIRVRRNNMSGTITDNPLAQVSTTINSPSFVDLPVINGTNHMLLILDPLEVNGAAEIVMVTAHVSAATSVTVTRGVEGSVPRAHNSGTTWFHGPVTSDTVEVLTSSTRPAIPYEGELLYETDTDIVMGSNGTAWGKLGSVVDTSPYSAHFQANPPACRVFHSVAQSVTDNSQLILAFDSERFDTDNMHSTTVNNSRITINTAGLYLIAAHVEYAASTYEYSMVGLRINGGTFIAISDASATNGIYGAGRSVAAVWKFGVGEYVEVRVFQKNAAAAARNVVAVGNYSPEFSATWIGIG